MSAAGRLAVITVTYHPDLARLRAQLARLPASALVVLVDNASDAPEIAQLTALASARRGTQLVRNVRNLGLAAAVNQGAGAAARIDPGVDTLLLLDQDSVPEPGSIAQLQRALAELEGKGARAGCVGPRLVDDATGLQHGFHCIRGWRWSRVFPETGSTTPVDVANLNGSGTLLRRATFERLGGLESGLFIDHVDTEWAFRVRAAGLHLYGIPQAAFAHRMGDRSLRFWCFGWRVWPQRSPLRHYYLFRNAVTLLRRPYVPRVWKFWAVVKLGLTLVVHGVFDGERRAQLRSMWRGIGHGLRKVSGGATAGPG
jgi:rhamnosyltransferase